MLNLWIIISSLDLSVQFIDSFNSSRGLDNIFRPVLEIYKLQLASFDAVAQRPGRVPAPGLEIVLTGTLKIISLAREANSGSSNFIKRKRHTTDIMAKREVIDSMKCGTKFLRKNSLKRCQTWSPTQSAAVLIFPGMGVKYWLDWCRGRRNWLYGVQKKNVLLKRTNIKKNEKTWQWDLKQKRLGTPAPAQQDRQLNLF